MTRAYGNGVEQRLSASFSGNRRKLRIPRLLPLPDHGYCRGIDSLGVISKLCNRNKCGCPLFIPGATLPKLREADHGGPGGQTINTLAE
jgi:hypothetical protein